ncbi:SPOR domain-containing protein [Sphingobium sp. TCM1]|uniref:SPOR domain-containing protein n=1 Tax=Sphingobium sp. TCM1 TaxID=453246 RepID=UPI000832BD10|nr:SPOR domain-containing protein [Sphingobium sp. TCM1]
MSWREGLRKGRSHLLFALILAVAGTLIVHIEDNNLERETGHRPVARAGVPTVKGRITPPVTALSAKQTPAPDTARPTIDDAAQFKAYVQVGAFRDRHRAEQAGASALRSLNGQPALAVRVKPFAKIFRAELGPIDPSAAKRLCARLLALGHECRPIMPRSAKD